MKTKEILFWITMIIGIALGIYAGGWLLFIKPIVTVCVAYDTGTITGNMIEWAIFKCLILAPIVAKVIIKVTLVIAEFILS